MHLSSMGDYGMKNLLQDKKGESDKISLLIGGVLLVLFVVVIAPVIFGSNGLTNSNFTADAPAWVVTLLTLIVGIGLVLFVYRSFAKGK